MSARGHLVVPVATPEQLQAQIVELRGELQAIHARVAWLERLDRRPWWTRFAAWLVPAARRIYGRLQP